MKRRRTLFLVAGFLLQTGSFGLAGDPPSAPDSPSAPTTVGAATERLDGSQPTATAEAAPLDLSSDAPRPIPLTRLQLKQLIENVKERSPRIPLPPLSAEDRELLGERADDYETRLRYHYLGSTPSANRRRSFFRADDSRMSLDYAFKVELFWIVSRVNNCQYCLGHQETKLLAAGLNEDQIAALDCDWSRFTGAEQAAFAFARKLTFEPHLLTDKDIESLRGHYTDLQILEMILSMAGNNSINRWKEGVGVPQRADEGGYSRLAEASEDGSPLPPELAALPRGSYLTPTSARFAAMLTRVAPVQRDPQTGEPSSAAQFQRPRLESPDEVRRRLDDCRRRAPRLPLADTESTKMAMEDNAPLAEPLPNWMRLLANFPSAGGVLASRFVEGDRRGDLSPLLKAQLSWIIARQDRTWYALGHAYQQLREQGQTEDQIFALDGDWSQFSPREQSLFTVARNLAASPVVLTDNEVAAAVGLAGAGPVVQTIHYTTGCAAFGRITEAAGLPLE